MNPHKPYFLTLLFSLVTHIHANEQTEFTDLLAVETNTRHSQLPADNLESRDEVEENEMGRLIRPTSASSTISIGEDETTNNHHGKPTMTVTAIRLGTSRYFHPGTFDHGRDEYPHSVIFPVTAMSPVGTTRIKLEDFPFPGSGLPFAHHDLSATLPSFDYDHDHEFPTLSSFEYYPEHESLTPAGPLAESKEDKVSSAEKSQESKEVSTETTNFSISTEPQEKQDISTETVTNVPTESPVSDPWPRISSANKSDNLNLFDFPKTGVSVNVSPTNDISDEENYGDNDDEKVGGDDALLNYFENGNEIPEVLPSPVALIDPVKDEQLQDEFGEALRKVEPRPRQRRPGPGTKRRIRMRVRKINTSKPTSDNFGMISEPTNAVGVMSRNQTEETNTKSPNRRYRSTTTTPIPDPSPPTVPSTKYESTTQSTPPENYKSRNSIVIKKGPSPIILQTSNLGNEVLGDVKIGQDDGPQPQIEKPNNAGFTEKINTNFFPSPIPNSSDSLRTERAELAKDNGKVGTTNNSATEEWLQPANSNHHSHPHHHDDENHFQDRDNWEKNYMNLQQNSFYGASPETLEQQHQLQQQQQQQQQQQGGQTLVDLNRDTSVEHHTMDKGDEHVQGSLLIKEHRQAPPIPIPSSGPNSLFMHSVRIPENEPGTSVTFTSPTIILGNNGLLNTESPELAIIQRPPESQSHQGLGPQAHGSEDSHTQYVSHLERPLMQFHSEEIYTPIDHPDLTGPTSSSEPHPYQPQMQYERSKYEFAENPNLEFQGTESEPSTPKPLTIITAKNPAPQVVYTGFQFGDNQEQQLQQNINTPPPSPQYYPAPSKSRPFSSDEFLGFGNDKHLMPEHIPQSNHLQKTPDFEKPSKSKSIGGSLQKESSTFSNIHAHSGISNNEELPNPEGYNYHSEDPYSKNNPFEKSYDQTYNQEAGKSGFTQSSPFIPFPREYSGMIQQVPAPTAASSSALGARQLPTARGERQLSYDTSDNNQQYNSKGVRGDSTFKYDFSNNYPNVGYHNQKQRPPGVSPTITLPMPALVSIPTPPPDTKAMHEVTPNRHFPPHTHSMASRPDYEPANPPLPNGHPLQHHFDPFIQNAGEFHDEDSQKHHQHGNNVNSNFKNFKGQSQASYSVQASPNYAFPQSDGSSSQSRPSSPYDMTSFDGQEYPGPPPPGKFKPSTYFADTGYQIVDKGTKSYPSGPQATYDATEEHEGGHGDDDYGTNVQSGSNFLDHEGESQEAPKEQEGIKVKPKQPETQTDGQPSPYSNVPYVLMFSNSAPDAGKHFPVGPGKLPSVAPTINKPQFSAVDPTALGSEHMTKNSLSSQGLGPGYHAVPVHPRDQMLQVLATKHYQSMLDEYMEKKKKPASSIYTPYGVLVPVGPTAAASTHQGHEYGQSSAASGGLHNIHHPHHGFSFNLKSPLLNTFKHFEHDKGRVTANFGLKATVEPALEILAEKVALKLSALEYLLKHPKHTHTGLHNTEEPGQHHHHSHPHDHQSHPHDHQSHPHGHQSHHDPVNTHGSYSEQKPMKLIPGDEHKKPFSGKPSPGKSTKSKSINGKKQPDKESSENFKLYIKELLKARLYDMLSEIDETEAESKIKPKMVLPDPSPTVKSWTEEKLPQQQDLQLQLQHQHQQHQHKLQQLQQQQLHPLKPMSVSNSINLQRKPPPGGILQSIKRFFTFGGGRHSQHHSPDAGTHPMMQGGNHVTPNLNFSRHPSGLHHEQEQHGGGQSDKSSSSNGFKHKSSKPSENENERTSEKLSAKDVEQILSILLKSETSTESLKAGLELQKRRSDSLDPPESVIWGHNMLPQPTPNTKSKNKKVKNYPIRGDGYEPMMSGSMNRPMGIRMVAPPRHNHFNGLEGNRRNFINSKIDKGHWRMPRSFRAKSRPRVSSSSRSKPLSK